MDMMAAVLPLCLLLLFTLLPGGDTSNSCSYNYTVQPPTMLDCDPLGRDITLWCCSASNKTWYWTQNISEAGVTGKAILPGDSVFKIKLPSLCIIIMFNVTESTLGYYWCEISSAVIVSLRPSTVTPVCPPMSYPTQQKCNRPLINKLHQDATECAEVDSPTVFSRLPLPTSCAVSTPSVNSWSFLVPAVITVGVLVVVLVVVVVIIIIIVVCVLKKNKTDSIKSGENRPKNVPEVLTLQPSMEQNCAYSSPHNYLLDVDKPKVTAAYPVLSEGEGHLVEQADYFVVRKSMEQELKEGKIQPQPTNQTENLYPSPYQEPQETFSFEKLPHVYAQSDL